MNKLLIKYSLTHGFKCFFKSSSKLESSSYEEREDRCIFSKNYFFELEQRYANNILFCYLKKEKKLYLVASSSPINGKIDNYQLIMDEFNASNIKGDIVVTVESYCKLWNASAYLVNNFGTFDGNKSDKVLCLYEEIKTNNFLSVIFHIRKFRKDLDLYKTIKSRKIRSLYNSLGSLVSGYSNAHE